MAGLVILCVLIVSSGFLTRTWAEDNSTLACGPDWHLIEDQCYRVMASHDHGAHFSMVYNAQRLCREHGGYLGSLTSLTLQDQVMEYVRSLDIWREHIYIGLILTNDEYRWMDGPVATFLPWGRGQPDMNFEDCVVARSPDRKWRHIEWHDYPCCSSSGINYTLCQKGTFGQTLNSTELDEIDLLLARKCSLEFSCRVKDLPHPRNASHATIITEHVKLDDDVTFTCKTGCTFGRGMSSKSVTCAPWGWRPVDVDDCREIRCVPNPQWEDLIANETKHIYTPGDVINYNCTKGYLFSDGTSRKEAACGEDEKWFPPLVNCSESRAKARRAAKRNTPTAAEAPSAVFFGTVAIIFISIELGMVVLSDVGPLKEHFQYMSKSFRSRFG